MTNQALFQPYDLGLITLTNHIVMAPLTRNRAGAGLVLGWYRANWQRLTTPSELQQDY